MPGGFLSDINPNSLSIVDAVSDKSIVGAKVYDKFQFERVGFFSVDPDSTKDKVLLIFTISSIKVCKLSEQHFVVGF